MYWRGKCRIGFRFVFDKNNEFHSRTAMDQRVNIINVASTQIQIYSLDGPTYSGGFKLKKHGKIVGRFTCLSSLGTNTLSLIKIKIKLSKREQTEHEHHKKRRKLFVSSPKWGIYVEELWWIVAWLSCLSSMEEHLDLDKVNTQYARRKHSIVEIFIAGRASKK